jgi:hypothetical protein
MLVISNINGVKRRCILDVEKVVGALKNSSLEEFVCMAYRNLKNTYKNILGQDWSDRVSVGMKIPVI